MWDIPGPGLKPVSPALAGGFLTTVPTREALLCMFLLRSCVSLILCPCRLLDLFFPPEGSENFLSLKSNSLGFPGGTVVENLPANAGDTGSSPGLGRSHMPRSN